MSAYRTPLHLQQHVTGQDDVGQPSTSWQLVQSAALWCDVRLLNGLQTIRADQQSSVVKASVRIQWRSSHPQPVTMRLLTLDGLTAYRIQSVIPDPAKQHIDLVCEVAAP